MPEKLLTIKELAKYLDIHKITLYRWVKQKKIPAVKIGKLWRFKKDKIDAWFEKQENKKI